MRADVRSCPSLPTKGLLNLNKSTKFIDLTGKHFGQLTVLRRGAGLDGKPSWICRCSCGNEKDMRGKALRGGRAKTCGCIHTKHGQAHRGKKTPEYLVWVQMKHRCGNPKDIQYKNYGGRGIRVSDPWLHSFENFLADMGPRPSGARRTGRSMYSIERRDNNKGYSKENCIWAMAKDQHHNQRPRAVQSKRNHRTGRFMPDEGTVELE